jgi:hypothetical protein
MAKRERIVIPAKLFHVLAGEFQVQGSAPCLGVVEVLGKNVDSPSSSLVEIARAESTAGAI